MKDDFKRQMTSSRAYVQNAKSKPTVIIPSTRVRVSRPVNNRRGMGSILVRVLEGIDHIGEAMNQEAINREIDRHMSELEIGQVRTVTISFGGGEARTVMTNEGTGPAFSPSGPSMQTFRLVGRLPRNQRELSDWTNASIERTMNNRDYITLPADATFDRGYRESRDRIFRDFDRGFDRSPRVDYDANDRNVMWA